MFLQRICSEHKPILGPSVQEDVKLLPTLIRFLKADRNNWEAMPIHRSAYRLYDWLSLSTE